MGDLLSIWEEMLIVRHCLIQFRVNTNSVAVTEISAQLKVYLSNRAGLRKTQIMLGRPGHC